MFYKYVCVYEGTAMISGKRGQVVLTDGNDEEHLSEGVYDTYTKTNLRYSQVRSTMHVVVCITQHIHTYTDIPRRHRWTCSKKKGTPKQISQHKLIFTLPPVPGTTSKGYAIASIFFDVLLYMFVLCVRVYVRLCACMYV